MSLAPGAADMPTTEWVVWHEQVAARRRCDGCKVTSAQTETYYGTLASTGAEHRLGTFCRECGKTAAGQFLLDCAAAKK